MNTVKMMDTARDHGIINYSKLMRPEDTYYTFKNGMTISDTTLKKTLVTSAVVGVALTVGYIAMRRA